MISVNVFMAESIGQSVRYVKDRMSSDAHARMRDNVSMQHRGTEPPDYKRLFCERVRNARKSMNLDQAEMATMLGIKPDTYGKYEKRSLLPHHLIPRWCEITGHDPWYLLTGRPAHSRPQAPPEKAAKGK